jgi:DNA-binding MarR family transcriptional regulator
MGDVDDLVELSRLLVSAAHRSLAAAGGPVTLQQFRALAVLARRGPQASGALAVTLDLHPSTVSRLCAKLVDGGWLTRSVRPDNRREVELDLTAAGQSLVKKVFAARARELETVLDRLPRAGRGSLAALLPQLLDAAERTIPDARVDWAV